MKNLKKILYLLSLLFLLISCKKDTGVGSEDEVLVPEIKNCKWTFKGIKYTGDNPKWGIPLGGSVFMFAETKVGDTTIFCDLTIPGYLRTGKFQLYTYAPNVGEGVILVHTKQVGNTIIERHISTYGLNDSIELKDNGEYYTATCNNITLLENYNPNIRKLFSCELKFKKPIIPAANANYTIPTGVPQNKIFVNNVLRLGAGATGLEFTITNYGGFFQSTYSGYYGGLKLHFSDAFPPSGTYDIISDLNLKPGKVFIQYIDPDPIASYNSSEGGTATIITAQNKLNFTFGNTTFNRIGNVGNPTIQLKASVGFY